MAVVHLNSIGKIDAKTPLKDVLERITIWYFASMERPMPRDTLKLIEAIASSPLFENEDEILIEAMQELNSERTPSLFKKKLPSINGRTLDIAASVIQASPLFSIELKRLFTVEAARVRKISDQGFITRREVNGLLKKCQAAYDFEQARLEQAIELLPTGYFKNHLNKKNYAKDILERSLQYQDQSDTGEWINIPLVRGISLYLFKNVENPKATTAQRFAPVKRELLYRLICSFLNDVIIFKSGFDADLKAKFIKNQIQKPLPKKLHPSLIFLHPFLRQHAAAIAGPKY